KVVPPSSSQIALNFTTNCIFTAILTYLYAALHRKNEKHLIELNQSLDEEKQTLIQKELLLIEAQKIAQIGSWSFEFHSQEMVWSPEIHRIFEVSEQLKFDDLYPIYRKKIHPDDLKKIDEAFDKAKSTGEGFIFDHRIFLDRGQIKFVQGIGNVLKDRNGNPFKITGTFQNITERFHREQSLRQIYDNVPVGIIKLSLNGRFIEVNKFFAEMLGFSEEEMRGKSVIELTHPEDQVSLKAAIAEGAINEVKGIEKRLIHKLGRNIWCRISSQPVKLNALDSFYILGVAEDITDIKIKNEELKEIHEKNFLIQKIDQAMAKADDFNSLIQGILKAITDQEKWAVSVYWDSSSGGQFFRLVEVTSKEPDRFRNFINYSKTAGLKKTESLSGRVFLSGKPAWIPSMSDEIISQRQTNALIDGIRGGFAFPVTIEKSIVGVVELYAEQNLLPLEVLNSAFMEMGSRIGLVAEKFEAKDNLEYERFRALKSAERFEAVFKSSPNPILVFGEMGILDCNLAAIKILGAPNRESLLFQHPARFSPEVQPDGRRSDEKSIEMDGLARKNGNHNFEWLHKKFDGTVFPVDVTLAPVDWNDNKAILVLWTDLTEKKKQDLKMIQNSKLASLGELSAGIAHEINNPLSIILASASMLSNYESVPEGFAKKIDSISKSVARIGKIVNGLRKFSRSGNKSDLGLYSLSSIVAEAIIMTESKAKQFDVSVSSECTSEASILCNEVEIGQSLINLISNAMDAVENLPEKWIRIF
ncbi:MAG: PAS domain S-box protein, partial [Bdellovibrionota bacterium]